VQNVKFYTDGLAAKNDLQSEGIIRGLTLNNITPADAN
jgi:hypothetical protein